MSDMTHSYEWHDSFRCVTWLIHMSDIQMILVWHVSFWLAIFFSLHASCSCALWNMYPSMIPLSIRKRCVTCFIHMWDMSDFLLMTCGVFSFCCILSNMYPSTIHLSILCVAWFNYTCDMSHLDVWHVSFWCVTCLVLMCDMSHFDMWLVFSLMLYFAKHIS